MSEKFEPIIIEQSFHNPIEDVWDAITSLHRMRVWFFESIPAFEARVGFETQFKIQSEERSFMHLWEIVEVIPKRKIVYQWKYQEYAGESYVTFDLFSEQQGTKLQLTAEGFDSFPQEIPEFKRESCLGGWNYFIKDRLVQYLCN